MSRCRYCHKDVTDRATVCPHCGKHHPTGVPLFRHPAVIVAVVIFSYISFLLFHTYSKVSDVIALPLSVLIVVFLFWFFTKLGVFCG